MMGILAGWENDGALLVMMIMVVVEAGSGMVVRVIGCIAVKHMSKMVLFKH